MDFNIEDFKALVEKINKPSVIIYCSSTKESWVKKAVDDLRIKAQIRSFDYEDDKIFIMPAEELDKPIKVVYPEYEERLKRYLGFESEE